MSEVEKKAYLDKYDIMKRYDVNIADAVSLIEEIQEFNGGGVFNGHKVLRTELEFWETNRGVYENEVITKAKPDIHHKEKSNELSKTWYTCEEVSEMYRVHAATVRKWIKRKQLNASKLANSKLYRITREDIDEFERQAMLRSKEA